MPRRYSISPSRPLVLDAPVATIETLGADVHVDGPLRTTIVFDRPFDARGMAGLWLNAVSGTARVVVTYVDEAVDEKVARMRREAGSEVEAA